MIDWALLEKNARFHVAELDFGSNGMLVSVLIVCPENSISYSFNKLWSGMHESVFSQQMKSATAPERSNDTLLIVLNLGWQLLLAPLGTLY